MKRETAGAARNGFPSFWDADRLAYAAVLAGAMSQIVQAFSGRVTTEPADGVWYWVAVPLMLLAIYTIVSGIALRRKLASLGDFDALERSSHS